MSEKPPVDHETIYLNPVDEWCTNIDLYWVIFFCENYFHEIFPKKRLCIIKTTGFLKNIFYNFFRVKWLKMDN